MIEQIVAIVKERYSSDFFNFHIKPVLKNALALTEAKELSEAKYKAIMLLIESMKSYTGG